jgi:chromosome partitioning protein
MMLAVVNQKGGVGKTTLAVHLAVWHLEREKRVAFIDADGQSASSRWLRAGRWDVTLLAETEADSIVELAGSLESTHDLVIADGPASLAEGARALLLVADHVLVPCGVTVPELEATAATIRMLRNARKIRDGRKPSAHLVLSRIRGDRFLLTRDARVAVQALGLPVCEQSIRLREAVADAPGQGSVVWKMGPRAKQAAREMLGLIEEVDDYVRTSNDNGSTSSRAETVSAWRPTGAARAAAR